MKISGNKFLVTGGAGFIPSHLVDMLLERGAEEVRIIDNFVRGTRDNIKGALKDPRCNLIEGDIRSTEDVLRATKNIDGVFHTASMCLGYCQDNPREGYDVNVTGTLNVLEACAENKVGRLIFSSSSSVYGNAAYSPMDENHPFENKNIYGATKICGEALCRAYSNKYKLPYLSLRYMNVFGPRQDYLGTYVAVIIRIIDRINQSLPPVIHGDGSQAFDFVYVKDICRANCLAMESNATDDVFNISSGKGTTVLELCKKIMKIMKSKAKIEFIPEDTSVLVTKRIGSTGKAKKRLGFEIETEIDKGLALTVQWKKAMGK
ncbi:MAG: NAD-dependent epimerase/dehydratase family protein [Victivallales bacterium]